VPPKPAELTRFAQEHLAYEVKTLHDLTQRLIEVLEHDEKAGKRDLDYLDLATRNAQVESFAIHARNLLDFLYTPASVRADDVLAEHYVADWRPPELTAALSAIRPRVGKEIAHLTYHRAKVQVEAKNWNYGRIWLDMATVLRKFAGEARPELMPTNVREPIRELTQRKNSLPQRPWDMLASATNYDGPLK
jgi:hypothetical protein